MLYDKWWKSGLTCIRDEIKNKDGKANPLDFSNIGGVFVVLLIGMVIAIGVAFVEFVYKFKNTSKTGRVSKFGQKEQVSCARRLREATFRQQPGARLVEAQSLSRERSASSTSRAAAFLTALQMLHCECRNPDAELRMLNFPRKPEVKSLKCLK